MNSLAQQISSLEIGVTSKRIGRVARRNKSDNRWHIGQLRNALLWRPNCSVRRSKGNSFWVVNEAGEFKVSNEYSALCMALGLPE